MKVIDLLNKIANEQIKADDVISIEEAMPKKIKWGNHFFKWYIYEYEEENGEETLYSYIRECPHMLNDEVEILEEDKKIEYCDSDILLAFEDEEQMKAIHNIFKKINEIIERLNDLGK